MHQIPKVLELQERARGPQPAKFVGARISPAAGVAKNVEFFLSVCLFVCLFVRHAFVVTLSLLRLLARRC